MTKLELIPGRGAFVLGKMSKTAQSEIRLCIGRIDDLGNPGGRSLWKEPSVGFWKAVQKGAIKNPILYHEVPLEGAFLLGFGKLSKRVQPQETIS